MFMEELLVYLSVIYQGDYRKILRALQTKERPEQSRIHATIRGLKSSWTTLISNDYPEQLKNISNPPFVLFYYGNLALTKQPMIGMVGMRQPTEYGKKMAFQFAQDLSQRFVIVSGLAKGIDTYSHLGASMTRTVAVLGCGIDYCYPASNYGLYKELKKHGLVISEYPQDIAPKKYYFPWRNRLIAGLSNALVVVQAKAKSGTMTTVSHALEQGKSIYAVPCRIGDPEGTLCLLQDGAILLNDSKMLDEEIGI